MINNGSQALLTTTTSDGQTLMAVNLRHRYLRNLGFHPANMTRSPSIWLDSQQPTPAQSDIVAESEVEEKAEVLSTDTGSCGSSPSTDESGSDSDSPPDKPSNVDFRTNFLKRLSYSGVWQPEPSRTLKVQSILIFDWDDTLLCTSFLERYDGIVLPHVVRQRMSKVASVVKKVLELACHLGQPFIITNAKNGWVEHSAALWMPEVIPVLKQITIISARSAYEARFPDNVSQWKRHAFLALQGRLDQHALTNLISIGDSAFEMDAAHAMGDRFAKAVVKTVKFVPQPRPQELCAQLGLVLKKLVHIVEIGKPLQVHLGTRTAVGS